MLGISYLTLFSFSSENWKRPPTRGRLTSWGFCGASSAATSPSFIRTTSRCVLLAQRRNVPPEIVTMFREAVALTSGNTGLQLIIAFNYGARDEIVRAAKRLAQRVKSGEIDCRGHNPGNCSRNTSTRLAFPIPTCSSAPAASSASATFCLWQCAYSEFLFVDNFWPDFTRQTSKVRSHLTSSANAVSAALPGSARVTCAGWTYRQRKKWQSL